MLIISKTVSLIKKIYGTKKIVIPFLSDMFYKNFCIFNYKSFIIDFSFGCKFQDGRQKPRWRTKFFVPFDQKVLYGPKELPYKKWHLPP